MPDGNLNNPSLGWLRRWAEGKAKLLAVVSLPEETFKWAEASVKASMVFLRKFSAEEEAAWEAAWKAAEAHHRPAFEKRRTELCAQYGPRIACADDAGLAKLLKELEGLGVRRTLPEWRLKPPPLYPRGVVQTDVGRPRWEGGPEEGEEKKRARKLRGEFERRWSEAIAERSDELHRELRAVLRRVDREHQRALWQHVRAALDYPVFTAAPEFVGITATGAEGPNQLPVVLKAYRLFEKWVRGGAKETEAPKFEL
jgi:type I restriction enzyme M protein